MADFYPPPVGNEPWNWYAGGPVPNPTPPFRLPDEAAGPAPPVGPAPAPMSGGYAALPVVQGDRPKRKKRKATP